ncbi:hypothetical protein BSG1_18360, partial [Bacillus sp. SG-1]
MLCFADVRNVITNTRGIDDPDLLFEMVTAQADENMP